MKCGRFLLFEIHNRILKSETIPLKKLNNTTCNNILWNCIIDEHYSTLDFVYYTQITINSSNYLLNSTSLKNKYITNNDIVYIK